MAVGKPGVPSWRDPAGGQARPQSPADGPGNDPIGREWAAGTVGGSTRLQAGLSRGLTYGLWGAIGLALVLSLVNCAGSSTVTPSEQPGQAGEADRQPMAPPGGCAELVVASWLAGDVELLADVPGMPRNRPEPNRRDATHTYTAAVTPGNGAWSYLVGAEVRSRDEEDRWQPAGTQFFTVTMVPTSGGGGCQGWGPAALPAQVPAPQLAGAPPLPYDISLPTSGTELSGTLEAFFAGMLTGTENIERYVAPGVSIPALVPPPHQQVEVTGLRATDDVADPVPADGTVAEVLVTVTTDADQLPLVYPVTVAVRGGRWEVTALDPLVGTTVLEQQTSPADRTIGGSP